jgi:hypothetical protein
MDWTIRVSIHGGVMIFVVPAMSRPALIPTHPHIQSEAKFYSLARAPGMYTFISTSPPLPPDTFITWCLGLVKTLCLPYFTVTIGWLIFYTKPMWNF